MISRLHSLLVLALCTLLPFQAIPSDQPPTEHSLIEILLSDREPSHKDAACVQLKRIGTAAAVPALASLLPHATLSHSARLALESIPGPESDAALRAAVYQTTGLVRAGILDSIGHRHDPEAVPLLADQLNDSNTRIATAAASALGRIDHDDIPGILNAAQRRTTGRLRSVILDSLLQQANRALARGNRIAAQAIFIELNRSDEPHHIRSAAYRGLMASAEVDESLALLTAPLTGNDGAAQIAALSVLSDFPHPGTSQTLAELLPHLAPLIQAAVTEALAQRGDRAVASTVLDLTRSEYLNVQLAAISAIGILGDHSAIPTLLEASTSGQPLLQRAARESLLTLRHGQVTQALLEQLASASGPTLTELIRALGGRADANAIPTLLELAAHPEPATRKASFRALSTLSTEESIPRLIQTLLDERDPDTLEEARRAIAMVCRRTQEQGNAIDPHPIVQGITNTSNPHEARVALLQLCTLLPDPDIRATIRTATQDPHPQVRDAAIRALCDSRDPGLLPDLLAVAGDPATAGYRLQAIRGFVRLATEAPTGGTPANAIEHLTQILAISEQHEELRVVLAGFASQASPDSLTVATDLLDEEPVQAEAVQAVIRIAQDIAPQHPQIASSALHQVLALPIEPAQRERIEAQLIQLDAITDYITAWQVAGPYREEGKDYSALFDIAFPPEDPAPTEDVSWISLPQASSLQHPGIVDLLKSIGGTQCVVYLRTAVQSPAQQEAILELGTDDGVKAWLNGHLVHAHNVARPLTIGSDRVPVTLQPGWNTLLLKITQNNLGWEFTARFIRPDGSRLPELQVDPLHAMSPVSRSAVTVPH
jgi:HEAT repeat protein